jgi:hypothetical protein
MNLNIPKEVVDLDYAEAEVKVLALTEAVTQAAIDPEPCLNCEHRQRCADFRLACQNFEFWVDRGRTNQAPRVPSSEFYWRLFPNDIQGQPPAPSKIQWGPRRRGPARKP